MGYFETPTDEGKQSQFNEAFLKMARIHKLQDTINQCFLNPLMYNPQLNQFNYEIIVSCCDGLLGEVWSKANKKSRSKAKKLKKAIEESLIKYPVHYSVNDIRGQNELKFNSINWKVLKDWIFKYNLTMRKILGECGYDSPDKEDDDGL